MSTKELIVLGAVAVVLGGAAYFLNGGAKSSSPKLNGKAVFPDLDVSAVAKVEVGDKLALAGDDKGWTVASLHGYPADRAKLTENLLKLKELKVGQVVRGKTLDGATNLVLRDGEGKELAALPLGERHAKWGHGRYATVKGETVLVSDTLDAFDGDGKSFVETKIVDTPYISFNDVVEGLSEEELGFATGVVAKVTIGGDTNRTVTVGNKVKDGSDRYLKLDQGDWIYKVSSYSVDSPLPKPPPAEEKKEEPVAEEKQEPASAE